MSAGSAGLLRFVRVLEKLLGGGQLVRFRAPGWSMHPTIRNGEIITVAPLGRSPVRIGDVVLYRRREAAIAHRVVRVRSCAGQPSTLVLRGDAADSCDPPVRIGQVLGRVVAVERRGRARRLDVLSPCWSTAVGRALRRARVVRMKVGVLIGSRA